MFTKKRRNIYIVWIVHEITNVFSIKRVTSLMYITCLKDIRLSWVRKRTKSNTKTINSSFQVFMGSLLCCSEESLHLILRSSRAHAKCTWSSFILRQSEKETALGHVSNRAVSNPVSSSSKLLTRYRWKLRRKKKTDLLSKSV